MSLQPTKTGSRSVNQLKAKKLIDALRGGTDLETASAFAGLTLNQVVAAVAAGQAEHDRIEAGLEPNEANADALELWQEIYKARADAVVRAVAQIQKAANQGDWKAAAWWLERAMPGKYGTKSERAYPAVIEYQCLNGHTIAMTKDLTDASCGLCGLAMERI